VPTKALVDSGATRSCISRKFLKRLELRCQPVSADQMQQLLTANNSPMQICGSVDLDISVQV